MPGSYSSKVSDLPRVLESRLSGAYSAVEARSIARLLMEELTGEPLVRLLAEPDRQWDAEQLNRLEKMIVRLQNREPVQYILGHASFAGYTFSVQPGVLIPRGETEELLAWIEDDLSADKSKGRKSPRILDIGCGSGILGISLALRFPEALITCADKYPIPIRISEENARALGADVSVRQLDILNPRESWLSNRFDVIVSNPPYVTTKQKKQMLPHVVEAEPSEALFVPDDDPLLFYRAIAEFSLITLAEEGEVYFEINEELSAETVDLMKNYFEVVELRNDIHGKPRMLKAHGR